MSRCLDFGRIAPLLNMIYVPLSHSQDRFRSWCCENFPGGLDDCLTRMARQGDVKVEAPY